VSDVAGSDASFQRLLALYPQVEAIPAELSLRDGLASRPELERVLAATDQTAVLQQFDGRLRRSAAVIPIAWVVDARFVSPRLQGWREDLLGNVDYTSVISRAASRGP
jgi:hypothetical protein